MHGVAAEWRIRHKLTKSIQPPNPPLSSPHTKQLVGIAWKKPPEGSIKVNFDGSKTSQNAAGGYVIRDWSGHLLQAGAFNLGAASILIAEATAMRNGLRAALEAGFSNIHIEGDNKILIQVVQGRIQSPWKIQVLVQDILYYLQKCNHGLSLSSTKVWNQASHRDLRCILSEDNLGYTLARRVA